MNSVSEESRKCVEKHMEELKGGYKGVCPVCGKTIRICKSIRIEMGANTGSGVCPGCKKLLHMTFNEERKEMNLERFKDYQKRHGKECEANAKTDGKGSGI